jgi:hypothetical protein
MEARYQDELVDWLSAARWLELELELEANKVFCLFHSRC